MSWYTPEVTELVRQCRVQRTEPDHITASIDTLREQAGPLNQYNPACVGHLSDPSITTTGHTPLSAPLSDFPGPPGVDQARA